MSATPENSSDTFTVSLFPNMVLMEKPKKKNAPRSYAVRKANRAPEGELRRGTCTYRTADARTKALRLFNSIDIAELGDDLVMATLKYRGSRARRLKLAPNDESTNGHIEYFEDMLSEEIGEPVKFLWFKDMNELGGGMHFHILISRPKHLTAEELDVMVRACWAITTGQPVQPTTIGAAWTPKVSEVWYGKDAEQTFKNFVRYEGFKFNPETGKFDAKIAQKRVDQAWLDSGNYAVKWAGISTSLLPATPLELTITCACGNADVRAVMQAHSPAARNIVTFDCREVEGNKVDIDLGRWSFDLMGKGCTEFIKVTPELIEAIKSVEEAHADCAPAAPVPADEVSPVPTTVTDVSTPAESHAAVLPIAVPITKESPMKDINSALEGMLTEAEQSALEQEAFAAEEAAREARINKRAKVLAPRLEKLIAHAAMADPEVMAEFASMSLEEQIDSLLAPVAVVEIPRLAADPHARRPRFVASLESRTSADNAYLASLVRMERSVDAFMNDEITFAEHSARYEAESALIKVLMDSGRMTEMPLEWLADRRAGVL